MTALLFFFLNFIALGGGPTFTGSLVDTYAAYRKQIGDDTLRDFFHEYAWDDPAYFLGHTGREGIFLQFGASDSVSKDQAQKYLDEFSATDKKMEFYEAGHALNAAARLDRDRWLEKHLNLKKLDEKALEAIPQLK